MFMIVLLSITGSLAEARSWSNSSCNANKSMQWRLHVYDVLSTWTAVHPPPPAIYFHPWSLCRHGNSGEHQSLSPGMEPACFSRGSKALYSEADPIHFFLEGSWAARKHPTLSCTRSPEERQSTYPPILSGRSRSGKKCLMPHVCN